ncbi:MAG: hypothetical protein J0M35_01190 [Candidatus Obscuribacter phosphatis]|uniref:Uncharacterized protein n=1 Tax=Candidatus Obscuribacter phosphatis TaxID=1906157 RepID=A0A8J7P6C7_9BACT|nr:hypothetical protein [Candidatus Obscuribacter phosphatis]
MSYDFIACARTLEESDLLSWKTQDIDEASPQEEEKLRKFLEQVLSIFPAVEEDGLSSEFWSYTPELEAGRASLVLYVSYSEASSFLHEVVRIGRELQVSIFDPQTSRIYRPDGFSGLTLEVENQASYIAPTKSQIREAVQGLSAKDGPSLLFMEEKGSSDYSQVAGGDGAFTLEWREHVGDNFKHYVAGLKSGNKNEEVKIFTNGYHVKVKGNERLGVVETVALLTAFAESRTRPNEYEWRDITHKFL